MSLFDVKFHNMKKYNVFTSILFLIIISGIFHNIALNTHKSQLTRYKNICKEVFGSATNCKKQDTPFPYYIAYKSSKTQAHPNIKGYVFITTELTPEIKGFSGPIKIIVGISPLGKIQNLKILEQSETPSYTGNLNKFISQFKGKKATEPLQLGIDIDGITHATVTSKAITSSIRKGVKKFYKNIINKDKTLQTNKKEKNRPFKWDEIIVPLLIFTLAILSLYTKKQWIRWTTMSLSLIYLGIFKAAMLSIVHIANIILLRIPSFIHSPIWYMLIPVSIITMLIIGNIYCGSICPFGVIQETIYRSARKIKIKTLEISTCTKQKAQYVKYIILFIALISAIIVNSSDALNFEVFVLFFTANATPIGRILVVITLLTSVFHFRFWCKYICPTGAFNSLIARLSLIKIRVAKDICQKCMACEKVCAFDAINCDENNIPTINYAECNLCAECLKKCNAKALRLKTAHIVEQKTASITKKSHVKNPQDKIFVLILIIIILIISWLWIKNISTLILAQKFTKGYYVRHIEEQPISKSISNDKIKKIKQRIEKVGITPQPARYWKRLYKETLN